MSTNHHQSERRSPPSPAAIALVALRYRSAIERRLRAAESHLRYVAADLPRSSPLPRTTTSAETIDSATHLAVHAADQIAEISNQLATLGRPPC